MLTSRRLLVIAVLAIVVIAGAVLLANQRASTSQQPNELLYPELKTQADSVKAIRIYKAGDARALELLRNGADWTVTERNGYAVAPVKARRLVQALADAKLLEEKTSDPTKYSALSVEDVTAADAKGVRIEIEGTPAAVNLIVGKDGPGGKSSYVRRVGDKQGWLVSEQLSASPEIRDWLDKEVINITADRTQSASIAIEGKPTYSATKAARTDADFKVAPLPKGKELSSPSAANTVASALMNLSLDDVRPKAEVVAGKPAAVATYKTFDGLIVEAQGWKKDEKHYVTFSAAYDAALADQFKLPTATDKKTDAPAAPNVEEEAKKIIAKTGNWAYELPAYKYDIVFPPLDPLLKK